VAELAATRWNSRGNCLLVVGATYPEELAEVRGIAGDMPFLVPGVGAQGADVRAAIEAGQSADGRGLIVSSSRSIIHASLGADFAAAARAATILLRDQINAGRRRDAAA
jgi:orotidine-5'-phosphate decarboxylase